MHVDRLERLFSFPVGTSSEMKNQFELKEKLGEG